jgi:hypothetical protein
MFLKERRTDLVADRAFNRFFHDGCLGISPGEEDDAAGFKNGAATHGDRVGRNVGQFTEGWGCILAGHWIEMNAAGARFLWRTRLVEADVAGAPDAEKLEVKSTCLTDRFFVGGAMRVDLILWHDPARKVDVGCRNVDVIEQIPVHESPVALRMIAIETEVFIEVEGDDPGERQALFLMETDQFTVEGDRGAARGKTENSRAAFCGTATNQRGDFSREFADGISGGIENTKRNGIGGAHGPKMRVLTRVVNAWSPGEHH